MAREYAIDTHCVEDNTELRKCLSCGYGLFGLTEKGLCPECGVAFGDQIVLTGFSSKGGPISTVITGIVVLLRGNIPLLMLVSATPYLLTFRGIGTSLLNPCSIVGAILLFVGLRAMRTAGQRGGNLRWVLDEEGICSIKGNQSERKLVPWNEVKRVACPLVLGVRPRRWRVLKIRRGWRSWDLFRQRTPMLWIKGKTRSEMRALAKKLNDQFVS